MEQILNLKDLNKVWWCSRVYQNRAEKLQIQVDPISKITTQCYLTCYAIKWLLTGTQEEWELVENPTSPILFVSLDNDNHVFMLSGNEVYQSCLMKYGLTRKVISDEMVYNIRHNKPVDYYELVGVYQSGRKTKTIECFEPPGNLDLRMIQSRYDDLCL